ncbi:hypothetical protein [Pseudomonas chlororaphis]|uniref:hypothetical protein n=1 Tax=Pseudomonas chlororaphis TaxID=587753 RepID=UPI001B3410C2|nr:hypothetical protein [Pseudomonas chlororaphis]MBP5059752.1 hypothetical protein [Pseudomonas chlororaphis]MBP5143898.1 hypothetical protein [Pseudomonas chlororaphis]
MPTYRVETNEGQTEFEADRMEVRDDGYTHFLSSDGSEVAVYASRNIACTVLPVVLEVVQG